VTFLDDIIRANIHLILPDVKAEDLYSIKITRDGELYYDEEDGKLIEHLKKSLTERELGLPTRVLYDNRISKSDLLVLRHDMNLKKTDIMPGGAYHNFSDFFQFPQIKTRLQDQDTTQLEHPLEHEKNIIKALQHKDALLSFPYHKFDPVFLLLNEAATKKDVQHIYITLYRISNNSAVAKALSNCLKAGKSVTVFIEAKARFDEENNLEWGEKLEKLGATVLYSMPNIKVHSKILLIESKKTSIAYIGTGNFNEKSAKIYADFGLLTSKFEITLDLKQVFNYLLDPSVTPVTSHIWMSPFTLRQRIYDSIDKEIDEAQNGGSGILMFKMNSLEDKAMIDKLYEAAEKGVNVKLIVRGICCLNPLYEKTKGNIKVISIVGKYLEHSRIYAFGADAQRGIFIGSADCMTRNLDKRVEVVTPVLDEELKTVLLKCFSLQWNDNTKARIIDGKQSNTYQSDGSEIINAQEDFKKYLKYLA
jgi:polyphosphate kinase